jgi:hypothetical protein
VSGVLTMAQCYPDAVISGLLVFDEVEGQSPNQTDDGPETDSFS